MERSTRLSYTEQFGASRENRTPIFWVEARHNIRYTMDANLAGPEGIEPSSLGLEPSIIAVILRTCYLVGVTGLEPVTARLSVESSTK